MAALLVQLMSAGGAGGQAAVRAPGDPGSVSENFSALKSEVTSLTERFKAARERRRLQAAKEREEWERGPKAPAQPQRQ
ncbi:hypothetical protein [Myxococcus sp. Y35]|uniref:hypothetical protein n=1 Tax=Pseudomyxococcus flavus TaxID=3115648 RepID=UPI003CEB4CC9